MVNKLFPDGAAIVFGGSGGIGRGVAMQLAEAGSDVAIVYRSKREVAEQAAEAIRATGRQASIHQVDVRDKLQIDGVIADVINGHGRVHTVVWGGRAGRSAG